MSQKKFVSPDSFKSCCLMSSFVVAFGGNFQLLIYTDSDVFLVVNLTYSSSMNVGSFLCKECILFQLGSLSCNSFFKVVVAS